MSATYKAIAERDEAGWWNATVPDVPGAFTQAKRLALLGPRVAEAIAAMQELDDADGITVELVPRLPGPVEQDIRRARRLRAEADHVATESSEASRRAARLLVGEMRLTVRDAGELLGVSPQRIAQLVKD